MIIATTSSGRAESSVWPKTFIPPPDRDGSVAALSAIWPPRGRASFRTPVSLRSFRRDGGCSLSIHSKRRSRHLPPSSAIIPPISAGLSRLLVSGSTLALYWGIYSKQRGWHEQR